MAAMAAAIGSAEADEEVLRTTGAVRLGGGVREAGKLLQGLRGKLERLTLESQQRSKEAALLRSQLEAAKQAILETRRCVMT